MQELPFGLERFRTPAATAEGGAVTTSLLPENIFLRSLILTIAVLVALLIVGLLISWASDRITIFIARFTGSRIAFGIRNYLTYIGTVHHELSHALLALISGAKVEEIHLMPKGEALGYVNLTPRGPKFLQGFQLSLSAIAPMLCGLATLSGLSVLYGYVSGGWRGLILYLALSIFFHMNLSPADIKNFVKGLLPTTLLLYLLILLLQITGILAFH